VEPTPRRKAGEGNYEGIVQGGPGCQNKEKKRRKALKNGKKEAPKTGPGTPGDRGGLGQMPISPRGRETTPLTTSAVQKNYPKWGEKWGKKSNSSQAKGRQKQRKTGNYRYNKEGGGETRQKTRSNSFKHKKGGKRERRKSGPLGKGSAQYVPGEKGERKNSHGRGEAWAE